MTTTAVEVARAFWHLMGTNDFKAVGAVLADDFVLEWPQSKERLRGRDRFATMNMEFPAKGRWVFTINRIVGSDAEAVTDVSVSDGSRYDRAITFFAVQDGKITRIVEYWPEPFAPAENRKHLVEPME
ncbi:MAG TPA: nuclear transport factor 2 family protein [Candidatus Eisenbacteria bacterium]|nr:nuclear transport factor 2 family protein [Candidatus Eisenbacteria bacterium]